MIIEEVHVGEVYKLKEYQQPDFEVGVLVRVLRIDNDSLIQVELANGSSYTTPWVYADELEEEFEPPADKKQEFLDMFKQCITDGTIEIESTPHGAIRISVDGERLIES